MDKDRDFNEKGPEAGKDNQRWQDKDSGRSDKEHAKPVQLDKEQEKSPRPGGGAQPGGQPGQPGGQPGQQGGQQGGQHGGQQGGQHGQPSPASR